MIHFKKEFLTEVLDYEYEYEYDKSIRDVSTSTPPSLFNRLVQKASIKFLLKIGRLSFLLQNKKNLIAIDLKTILVQYFYTTSAAD